MGTCTYHHAYYFFYALENLGENASSEKLHYATWAQRNIFGKLEHTYFSG